MSAFADDLLAEQEGIEVAMQEKPKVLHLLHNKSNQINFNIKSKRQ
jgi:hypothetical protein